MTTETTKPVKAPKAPKAPKPEKIVMPEQNGIRQPKPGTLCAKAWDLIATLPADAKAGAAAEAAKKAGLNPGNVSTELSRYRRFHKAA